MQLEGLEGDRRVLHGIWVNIHNVVDNLADKQSERSAKVNSAVRGAWRNRPLLCLL